MPDIIGLILQRLDALEAAVKGRASEHFDRKLFKAEVALRDAVERRETSRRDVAFDGPRQGARLRKPVVGQLYCGDTRLSLMLPAVDLGGRVWLGSKPCKGGPAAPAFGG